MAYIKELGYDVKGYDLGFKDIDTKQGIVVGYFSAFGVKDWDNQIVVKGAFKKSIDERGPKSAKPRIKHLLDHNKKNAVATIQDLQEDETGLRYESKAGRHTAGQDWLKMCEDGIITEHSTGCLYPKDKIQKSNGVEYLHEAMLFEGSSLQFLGANGNTPIVSIKEMKFEEVAERLATLEKAWNSGTYSDDAFKSIIEPQLKEIKELLKILSNDTTQPGAKTDTTEPDGDKNKQKDILTELFTFKN